jgi:hypothetical protein
MVRDEHRRTIFVRITRQFLRSHDGALESLEHLRGQIETWFAEWEARNPSAEPVVAAVTKGGFDVGEFVNKKSQEVL